MVEDKKLEIFVGRVKKLFEGHLKKAILFGSRARGDSVEGSDYDFLLIFDNVTPEVKENISELTGEMLYEYSVIFSAFPFTEESLHKKRYSPFIINAQKEGVLL